MLYLLCKLRGLVLKFLLGRLFGDVEQAGKCGNLPVGVLGVCFEDHDALVELVVTILLVFEVPSLVLELLFKRINLYIMLFYVD